MLTNRSMPQCIVMPVLGYPDVGAAVGWLEATVGFRRRLSIGHHRAQMYVGVSGAMVVVQDAQPKPGNVMVRVEDIEAHHRQAKEKGAQVLGEPATFPYGERQYSAIDLAGHCWRFSQSIADVDPAAWGGILA